jgi:hypothetical protein
MHLKNLLVHERKPNLMFRSNLFRVIGRREIVKESANSTRIAPS